MIQACIGGFILGMVVMFTIMDTLKDRDKY